HLRVGKTLPQRCATRGPAADVDDATRCEIRRELEPFAQALADFVLQDRVFGVTRGRARECTPHMRLVEARAHAASSRSNATSARATASACSRNGAWPLLSSRYC